MDAIIQSRRLGITGSIFGLLALVCADLPQWVLPAIFPPKPLEQVIVETGQRVKDRLIARVKRLEVQPRETSEQRTSGREWSQAFSIAAVSLGLLAIALAVSVIRREQRATAGIAAALGTGAIAFQLFWIAIGVLIVIMIVYAVLDHLAVFLNAQRKLMGTQIPSSSL
jgi:hypothetical protein